MKDIEIEHLIIFLFWIFLVIALFYMAVYFADLTHIERMAEIESRCNPVNQALTEVTGE